MSKLLFKLSQVEARSLQDPLRALSLRAGRHLSLDELLNAWEQFVTHVARGYQGSIYEYTNDLSVRDLLEQILTSVPQSLGEKLIPVIRPWDVQFYEATRESSRPVGSDPNASANSWWLRIPKRLGGALEQDLRSEHLIE